VTITTSAHAGPLTFDEVVVAVPLGCLKEKSMITFEPELPENIINAINHASISSYEKVFMEFSCAWWDTHGEKPFGGVHCLAPEYKMPHGHPKFSMEFVSLSSLKKKHSRPIILAQIYGECAKYIISDPPADPKSPEYLKFLCDFFKPYLAKFPNYNVDDPACKPTAVIATAWCKDKFAGNGSYTNFKVNEDASIKLDNDIRTMRTGQPDRGLWFAGEHVAPFEGLGTTTGAYWSGEFVAKRIAAVHGRAKKRGGAKSRTPRSTSHELTPGHQPNKQKPQTHRTSSAPQRWRALIASEFYEPLKPPKRLMDMLKLGVSK
jgi:hypothetical protein